MFKIAQDYSKTIKVTDGWLKKLNRIKNSWEGFGYTPTSDGSRKMMTEGLGLDKFKGFKDLNSSKYKLGPYDMYVDNINIPHKKIPNVKNYSKDMMS